jgi:hypothetical protein
MARGMKTTAKKTTAKKSPANKMVNGGKSSTMKKTVSKPKKYQNSGSTKSKLPKLPPDSVMARIVKESQKGYLPANENERLMVEKERAKMKAEKDKNLKEAVRQVEEFKKGKRDKF